MMKKRNIAVAMAAVSVASTVAPSFAAAKTETPINGGSFVVSTENTKALIEEVDSLLKEKFVDVDEKLYSIDVLYKEDGVDKDEKDIESIDKLKEIILNEKNTEIVLNITEKGNENKIQNVKNTYTESSLSDLYNEIKNDENLEVKRSDDGKSLDVSLKVDNEGMKKTLLKEFSTININSRKLKLEDSNLFLKFKDSNTTTISEFLKYVNENFAIIDEIKTATNGTCSLDDEGISFLEKIVNVDSKLFNEEELKQVNGLLDDNQSGEKGLRSLVNDARIQLPQGMQKDKPLRETTKKIAKILEDDSDGIAKYISAKLDVDNITGLDESDEKKPLSDKLYEVILDNTEEEIVKSETLFDGTMLTDEGKELINVLENGFKIGDKSFKVKSQGEYQINPVKDDNFELVMNFIGIEDNQPALKATEKPETIRFQIKVTSDDKEELENIKKMFTIDGLTGKVEGYAIDSIIGARRTETAVKISKENFEPTKKDGNVVLVGANAVVDGLAAGPLAALLDAPVLLTNADSLDAKVEEEISRLLVDDTRVADLKTQTVYIVGGESVVSENVVEQLENLGIKVERLAGDRRDTTSLAVAEKMDDLGAKFDKAFVVGAKGEADAMSIAAHAAKIEAPIIVNGLDGTLSKEAKKLIKDKQIDIIGGETVVSKELESELKDIDKDRRITRVQGSDRTETNANVIEKYYGGAKHVYIAKDGKIEGNDKLVDALAISPVAAEDGVVVLATNELTKEQKDALDLKASNAKKVTQVGGGVSETVVTKVAKLLGLVK